jgi:hypothetical protein
MGLQQIFAEGMREEERKGGRRKGRKEGKKETGREGEGKERVHARNRLNTTMGQSKNLSVSQ